MSKRGNFISRIDSYEYALKRNPTQKKEMMKGNKREEARSFGRFRRWSSGVWPEIEVSKSGDILRGEESRRDGGIWNNVEWKRRGGDPVVRSLVRLSSDRTERRWIRSGEGVNEEEKGLVVFSGLLMEPVRAGTAPHRRVTNAGGTN
ncbi:hypothetical protein HAX54_053177 [Datura stramonium]|uniref:Uncharacterized protein n=1 Tax=Datura stramonium TaxID=4076 RepID=A0ABS8WRZ0_DATST|nr:hypothetical protein [Datura stramonium]